jgi:cytochrome P450
LYARWFVTRYDDVWAVLKDTARFSSRFLMRTPADAPPAVREVLREAYPELPMLVNDDPPSHTRTHGLVSRAFAPRLVAALEPSIRSIVTRLVDGFAGDGGGDLIAGLAYQFDPGRSSNHRHLGFGRGIHACIHACIGASLARMETRIVLDTVAERLPSPKPDAGRPPAYFPSLMHRGPQALHVLWS